jgi:hypothetical protein
MTTDVDLRRVFSDGSGIGTPSADDLYVDKLKQALAHALYRTHPMNPGACDACARAALLLERGPDGLP